MGVVTINYDQLEKLAKQAIKTADELEDYRNRLSTNVENKISGCKLRPDTHYSQCRYYVKQKIKEISKKSYQYRTFASSVTYFSEYAQTTDQRVARKIAGETKKFIDEKEYIDYGIREALRSYFVDVKNKNPIVNFVATVTQKGINTIKHLKDEIKYWYKCGGGRELVKVIAAIALVVIAVVALVATGGGVLAWVAAIIAVVNAETRAINAGKAYIAKTVSNDPAWATIYSGQTTLADYLRETNFGTKAGNICSNIGALSLDILQLVCDIAHLGGGKNAPEKLKIITDAAGNAVKNNDHLLDWKFDGNTGDNKDRLHKAGTDVIRTVSKVDYKNGFLKGLSGFASIISDAKAIYKDIGTIKGLNGDYPYKHNKDINIGYGLGYSI